MWMRLREIQVDRDKSKSDKNDEERAMADGDAGGRENGGGYPVWVPDRRLNTLLP